MTFTIDLNEFVRTHEPNSRMGDQLTYRDFEITNDAGETIRIKELVVAVERYRSVTARDDSGGTMLVLSTFDEVRVTLISIEPVDSDLPRLIWEPGRTMNGLIRE